MDFRDRNFVRGTETLSTSSSSRANLPRRRKTRGRVVGVRQPARRAPFVSPTRSCVPASEWASATSLVRISVPRWRFPLACAGVDPGRNQPPRSLPVDFGPIRENSTAVDGLCWPETKGRRIRHRPLDVGQAPCVQEAGSANSLRLSPLLCAVTGSARCRATGTAPGSAPAPSDPAVPTAGPSGRTRRPAGGRTCSHRGSHSPRAARIGRW